MEIEQLRKEINQLLENVIDHSNRYTGDRHLPSLEISFVLSKLNKMQEKMIVLKHLVEEQENKTKQHQQDDRKELAEEVHAREIIVEAEAPVETIKEEVSNDKERVDFVESNERAKEISLGGNLEQLPISKLIDALTLNDRYLYANELFDKDMSAFNELVKSIDNSTSMGEAKGLFSKFDWDYENEHVLSFINLVERRFLT